MKSSLVQISNTVGNGIGEPFFTLSQRMPTMDSIQSSALELFGPFVSYDLIGFLSKRFRLIQKSSKLILFRE
jgi:hypothetical protein